MIHFLSPVGKFKLLSVCTETDFQALLIVQLRSGLHMEGTHEELYMADPFNESHTNQFFLSGATFWQVH